MGLLDSVIGAIAGGQGNNNQGGGGQAALLNIVMGMLANSGQGGTGGTGGIGDLIAKFQQGGLGNVVGSWIGTGQNLPVSADQLHKVLGSDTIANIAQQLGLSHSEAASQLSGVLPEVIDKLTPHGEVPEGGVGELGDIGAMLSRFTKS